MSCSRSLSRDGSILAPHTDDGELAAGASIARWSAEGSDAHYVAFLACATIQPPSSAPNTLRRECAAATKLLGVPPSNLEILGFEVRRFARDRQEVLDVMVKLDRDLHPDLVLMPSTNDTHQDHQVVASEARRAFKRTRMLGCDVPWNNFRFENSAFCALEERHVTVKCEALAEFRSQSGRPYMSSDYVRSQALFHGIQSGLPLAEVFQVIRWYL